MGSDKPVDTSDLDKALVPILGADKVPALFLNGESKEAGSEVWNKVLQAEHLTLLFFEQYGFTDKEIDPRVFNLPHLACLSLGRNQLTGDLFRGNDHLLHKVKDRLTLFFIDNCLIEDVPDDIFDLVVCEKLSLCNNRIKTLSPKVGQLQNLNTIYLSDNQLKQVPDALGTIPSLNQLYLHNNQLESIPETFSQLVGLRTLELSNNKLKEFPRPLLELKDTLTELYLNGNELSDVLPRDLQAMMGLQVLDVHDNPDLQSEPGMSRMLTALGVSLFLPEHLKKQAAAQRTNGLHFCAEYNLTRAAKRILNRPMTDRKEVLAEKNEDGRTPLMLACLHDNPDCAVLFVKFGAPLESVDNDGRTAIELIHYKAVRAWVHPHPFFNTKLGRMFEERGKTSLDEYIIVTDCCINWANYGTYGFDYQVGQVYHQTLNDQVDKFNSAAKLATAKLVSKRDSINPQRRGKYNILVHSHLMDWIVILTSARDIVRELTDEEEQKTRNRKFDPLCLHIMAVKGLAESVRPLMERGADITLRDSQGKTALHLAAEYGHLAMIKELVTEARRTTTDAKKAGVDIALGGGHFDVVHARDNSGKTPIHYAVLRGHTECIQQLLDYEAVPEFDPRPAILRVIKTYGPAKRDPENGEAERPAELHNTALHVLNNQKSLLEEMQKQVDTGAITEASAEYMRAADAVRVAEENVAVVSENKFISSVRDDFALRKFLWSFIPYLAFLVMLFWIARHGTSANLTSLPFKTNLADRIVDEEFPAEASHIKKTFSSIGGVEDFWSFVDGPLVNFIYPTEDGAGLALSGTEALYVDGRHNRWVGALRFRQLRMANGSCTVPDDYQSLVSRCHDFYSPRQDDEAPFGPPSNSSKYRYTKHKGQMVRGQFWNEYPASGFVIDVPLERDAGLAQIAELKNDNWVDKSTSVVFIEMTHYNGNINRLGYGRLMVEFPSSGGAFPGHLFRSVRPVLYQGQSEWAILVLEVVCALFVTAYFLDEIREMMEDGFAYWRDFWNYFDMTTTLGFMAIFVAKMMGVFERADLTLPPQDGRFLNLSYLASLTSVESNLIALVFMLSILKTSKFLTYIPGVGPLTMAIVSTVLDRRVIVFLVFLSVVLTSFAMGVYFAFGNDDTAYFTFGHSLLTMIRGLFGDLETDTLNNGFRILYFLIILIVAVLILMNLFIAVISEVYAELYEQNEENWNNWLTDIMAEDLRETHSGAPAITKVHFFNYLYRKKKEKEQQEKAEEYQRNRVVPLERIMSGEALLENGETPPRAPSAGSDEEEEEQTDLSLSDGQMGTQNMISEKAVNDFLSREKASQLDNAHLLEALETVSSKTTPSLAPASSHTPASDDRSAVSLAAAAASGQGSIASTATGVSTPQLENRLREQELRLVRTEDMVREVLTLLQRQSRAPTPDIPALTPKRD